MSADGEAAATEPKILTEVEKGDTAGPAHDTPKFEQPRTPQLHSNPVRDDDLQNVSGFAPSSNDYMAFATEMDHSEKPESRQASEMLPSEGSSLLDLSNMQRTFPSDMGAALQDERRKTTNITTHVDESLVMHGYQFANSAEQTSKNPMRHGREDDSGAEQPAFTSLESQLIQRPSNAKGSTLRGKSKKASAAVNEGT